MEFTAVIDKLDDLLASAKRARLSSDVRVDKQEIAAIIRQLRGSIPDELRQADWIAENRVEMLAEAKREAARIREEALEERARLLGRDQIAAGAERRAAEVLEEAAQTEQAIHAAAEEQAAYILDDLEAHFEKIADVVGRGRARLAERNPDQMIERDPDGLVAGRGGREAVRRPGVIA